MALLEGIIFSWKDGRFEVISMWDQFERSEARILESQSGKENVYQTRPRLAELGAHLPSVV